MNWTRLLLQCFSGKICFSTAMWKMRRTPPSQLYQNIMFCPEALRSHNSSVVLVFSIPAPCLLVLLPPFQLFQVLKFPEEGPKRWKCCKCTNLCFTERHSYSKDQSLQCVWVATLDFQLQPWVWVALFADFHLTLSHHSSFHMPVITENVLESDRLGSNPGSAVSDLMWGRYSDLLAP